MLWQEATLSSQGKGGRTSILCNSDVGVWPPPSQAMHRSASRLDSGYMCAFVVKTYQQKSSFLCYRLPKIVQSFQFRSFFIVF